MTASEHYVATLQRRSAHWYRIAREELERDNLSTGYPRSSRNVAYFKELIIEHQRAAAETSAYTRQLMGIIGECGECEGTGLLQASCMNRPCTDCNGTGKTP